MDSPITAERLDAQLLRAPDARAPEDVVGRLLAVQAQDPRSARLAVRARSTGLHAADVDRALSVDRSLAIGWLNRGTLHLVLAQDYWWLHALTTPQTLTGTTRRLAQEGVGPAAAERAMSTLRRALAEAGPLSRGEIGSLLASADVPTAGQALVHLISLACSRGIAVRGPVDGGSSAGRFEQRFASAHDWLGPPAHVDRDVALARLARRYLAGHGPADDRDLATWAGITLGAARAGLRSIAGSLVDRGNGLAALRAPDAALVAPPPRLLGSFDPVLLGWRSRDDIVGPHETAIVAGGVFRAFALVRGRAAGLWRISGGRVEVAPAEPLDRAEAHGLEREAADVERFLGLAGRDRSVSSP